MGLRLHRRQREEHAEAVTREHEAIRQQAIDDAARWERTLDRAEAALEVREAEQARPRSVEERLAAIERGDGATMELIRAPLPSAALRQAVERRRRLRDSQATVSA